MLNFYNLLYLVPIVKFTITLIPLMKMKNMFCAIQTFTEISRNDFNNVNQYHQYRINDMMSITVKYMNSKERNVRNIDIWNMILFIPSKITITTRNAIANNSIT